MVGGARERGCTLSQPLLSLPAYEQAVHEQKMRLETSQVRKEINKYMENVERSKQVAAIVERKQKRGEKLLEVSLQERRLSPCPPLTLPLPLPQHTQRRFRQRRVVETEAASSSSAAAPKEETLKPALDDSLLMKVTCVCVCVCVCVCADCIVCVTVMIMLPAADTPRPQIASPAPGAACHQHVLFSFSV